MRFCSSSIATLKERDPGGVRISEFLLLPVQMYSYYKAAESGREKQNLNQQISFVFRMKVWKPSSQKEANAEHFALKLIKPT